MQRRKSSREFKIEAGCQGDVPRQMATAFMSVRSESEPYALQPLCPFEPEADREVVGDEEHSTPQNSVAPVKIGT